MVPITNRFCQSRHYCFICIHPSIGSASVLQSVDWSYPEAFTRLEEGLWWRWSQYLEYITCWDSSKGLVAPFNRRALWNVHFLIMDPWSVFSNSGYKGEVCQLYVLNKFFCAHFASFFFLANRSQSRELSQILLGNAKELQFRRILGEFSNINQMLCWLQIFFSFN